MHEIWPVHGVKGRRVGKELEHAADAGAGADHHLQQQYSVELKHNPENKVYWYYLEDICN